MLLLPLTIFLLIPAPGPDRRLARESFSGLLRAISSLFRRSELYLSVEIVGGLFTLSLLFLPHNPAAFTVAKLGQNAFQALAFTVSTALALQTVGHGNALAATEYSILTCATNLPLFYMQFIDSHAYTLRGLPGAFTTDAGISIAVCVLLLGLLAWLRMRSLSQVKAIALEATD